MLSKQTILWLCVAIPLATAVAREQGADRLTRPAGDGSSVPQQPTRLRRLEQSSEQRCRSRAIVR